MKSETSNNNKYTIGEIVDLNFIDKSSGEVLLHLDEDEIKNGFAVSIGFGQGKVEVIPE